jgi:hypothetical protein
MECCGLRMPARGGSTVTLSITTTEYPARQRVLDEDPRLSASNSSTTTIGISTLTGPLRNRFWGWPCCRRLPPRRVKHEGFRLASDPPGTTIGWRSDEVIAVLVPRMEPTMWVRAVIGIVLCAVGTVWILQGTKVIQGSGMSGQGKWAVIGAVVVVVGLACFAWAARHHRRGTTESS